MARIIYETLPIASEEVPHIKERHIPFGHRLCDHIERCVRQSQDVETEVNPQ